MPQVWETLDSEVSRTEVLVRLMEEEIAKAVEEWGVHALRIPATKGGIKELYEIYRAERVHLARTAKQSMDAGTSKLRVMQARTNAEAIIRVLTFAIEAGELSPQQRGVVMGALADAMAQESKGVGEEGLRIIEG